MRKIDKSEHLATKYFEWLRDKEDKGEPHGKYSSSSFKYYKDIKMNLLKVQNGLCAYSEVFLGNPNSCQSKYWSDGRYIHTADCEGQIEHFDSSLKEDQCWLWDNLFLSKSDINTRIKGKKPVDEILKPDRKGYDPFLYLMYSEEDHEYFPHTTLPLPEQQRVEEMIITLGLNWDPIKERRRKYLDEHLERIEQGFPETLPENLIEFPTAYRMILHSREKQQ